MRDPALRKLRARLGGLALAAQRDPLDYTAKARQVFRDRFLEQQPAHLPDDERVRRAEAARRLFYARLALKSATARAKRRKAA